MTESVSHKQLQNDVDVGKCEEWIKIARAVKVCMTQALLDVLQDPKYEGVPKTIEKANHSLQKFRQEKESNLTNITADQWDCISHQCSESCQIPCREVGNSNIRGINIPTLAVLIHHLTKLQPPESDWNEDPSEDDFSKAACVLKTIKLRDAMLTGPIAEKSVQELKMYWHDVESILTGLEYHDMDVFYYLQEAALDEVEGEQVEILLDKCRMIKDEDPKADAMKKEIEVLKNLIKSYSLNETVIDEKVAKSLHCNAVVSKKNHINESENNIAEYVVVADVSEKDETAHAEVILPKEFDD